ncbi:cytochrome c biogenesis CcdA family protein [soil metagenome]
MIDGTYAVALTLGLVASVNPCGFAMLPAYLAYFLGTDGDGPTDRVAAGLLRALLVAAVVSAGFVAVFGVIGVVFTELARPIQPYTPWVTAIVGVTLVVLGAAMVRGFEPVIALPKLERGGAGRGLSSMFLFGVSYAVASLSCTLPVFTAVLGNAVGRSSVAESIAVFATYALGMGVVLMTVTVAVALARQSLVRDIRRLLPHVNRISGALLVITGAYVAGYGIYEIRLNRDPATSAGIFALVSDLSADISAWVQDTGPTRVFLVLAVVNLSVLLYALVRTNPARHRHRHQPQ